MERTIAVVATLDTKVRGIAYLKNVIEAKGCNTLIVDVGVFPQSELTPDISREEIAAEAGTTVAQVLSRHDRRLAIRIMTQGGAQRVRRLYDTGLLSGVIAIGGGTGTHIASGIMQVLPIGIPKLIVSTVASRDMRAIIGSKDITLVHAVADIIGLNFMTRKILADAAGAIVGMVMSGPEPAPKLKVVGLTSFGPLNDCAFAAQEMLEDLGYEVVPFHAIGSGSMAMENLIDQGTIHGVLDLSLHEFADQMYGGYCKDIGPARLEVAGRKGIPHVVLPGGLDMIAFECDSLAGVPTELRDRPFLAHDFRSFVRVNADDLRAIARIIADKVNRAKRPPTIVIPLLGWSKADARGGSFYEPQTDQVFVSELKSLVDPAVKFLEVDANINDHECARIAVCELHRLMETVAE